MRILIAEDDLHIRNGLVALLQKEGYQVLACADGQEALDTWRSDGADLILLDIMMPKVDGYDVCRQIRKHDEQIPVIFVSAKNEEIDRVVGLELGADDFLMKPFGTREVIARIKAVTRRCLREQDLDVTKPSSFTMGDIEIFPQELRAKRGEQNIELSLRECKILELLFQHAGKVLSKDDVFNAAWGRDYLPSSRTLDQQISKLRKLVEKNPKEPKIIQTVHGVGYRFE